MHIRCTRRMLDFLKPERIVLDAPTDMFSWHAEIQTVARKKLFIVMHDQSRFCVVIYGLTKKDFEHAPAIFRQAIYVTMRFMGYAHDLAFRYTENIKDVTFGPTQGRKLVAQLNRAVSDAWAYLNEYLVLSDNLQLDIAKMLNKSPVGTNHWKVVHFPYQKMAECLQTWSEQNRRFDA